MQNNKKNIVLIIVIVLSIAAVLSLSFAFFGSFTKDTNNNIAINITTDSGQNASFVATNNALMTLTVDPDNMTEDNAGNYTAISNTNLNVSLTAGTNLYTVTCIYDIVFEYDLDSSVYGAEDTTVTSGASKELTLKITGPNTGLNGYASETSFVFGTGYWNVETSTAGARRGVVKGAKISNNSTTATTQSWTMQTKFYNVNKDQTALANKTFSGKYYVDNVRCSTKTTGKASDLIIAHNGGKGQIASNGTPYYSLSETTIGNMFSAQDDLGISYYYRGAVNNNWVKFGQENGSDIWWRIIRVNGDGSVRMIYTGTTAPLSSSQLTGNGTMISLNSTYNFPYADAANDGKYVGFQYIDSNSHGYGKCTTSGAASCEADGVTVYNSNVKQKLELWWDTTNLSTLYSQGKIADAIYCNDRTAYTNATGTTETVSYGTSTKYYGGYVRLYNNKRPVLTCPNVDDRFTVNTNLGNGALIYPVGLITADEIAVAGALYGKINWGYYLYNGERYWTMTPFYVSSGNARNMGLDYSGDIYYYLLTNGRLGIRPVISLSGDVTLTGTGYYNDPYIVS